MAPTTRSKGRTHTIPNTSKPSNYNTIEKTRFFDSYDKKQCDESTRSVAAELGKVKPTHGSAKGKK